MRIERIEPRRRGPSRRVRVILAVVAVALFLVLLSLRGIARFWTDYLWFDSLGFGSVWSGLLSARLVPALVFTAVFFVILLANLVVADRVAPMFVPAGPEEEFVQRYREVIGPYAGRVRVGVALLFALIAGGGVAGHWRDWILFRNRVDFGVKDPQFDADIGFYVFQLPFLKFLFEWTFAALIIVFFVTAIAHYLNGGIRVRSPFEKVTAAVKVHLSVLLAVIALVRAGGYWLERFELNFSTRGAVHGAGYTDVKAQLPALNMLIVISLVGAVLFLVNIRRRGWVLPVLGVGLWAFVSLVIGEIYPAAIQRFRVEPNELSRETQYIGRNIEATRAAFGLEDVEVQRFDYREDLDAAAIEANRGTLGNVRLWDPAFLPETYRQLQRIRNFYEFSDVDIDRYVVGDQVVQTVLSARELNLGELPSNTWVNRHLVYTHGYGLVVSPASEVTEDGEPSFLVKDIPPQATDDTFRLERPELYFGENIDTYSIVRTHEEEFDYPRLDAGDEATTRYEGEGGIRLGGFFRRAAFALRFTDMRFFVSGELSSDSEVIFERDVRERVEKAAPFLHFDADPYPVAVDGRMLWIVDGYTTTEKYPYSQAVVPERLVGSSGLNRRFNYVRNSVKAVVDAYDGTVTYYVIDPDDPIVRAYRKAFPDLFTDGDEMSDELRAHLRYPEDLFRVQTDQFALYHVTDRREFYQQSDQWAIASDPGSGRLELEGAVGDATTAETRTTVTAGGRSLAAGTSTGRMDPYYLLMKLPGDEREGFTLMQPFTPPARRGELGNLLAFMVAKSDPGEYGKLQAFVMPGGGQVDGPTQVNAQMLNTPEIAREFTLLGQRGSDVIQGSLQLIPVENSILYLRPLYVEARGRTQFPQFQFVLAFYGGTAAIGETLDEALSKLFEGVVAAPPAEPPAGGGEPAQPSEFDQLRQSIEAAKRALEELQRQFDEIGNAVSRLEGEQPSESTTSTTATTAPAPAPAPAEA